MTVRRWPGGRPYCADAASSSRNRHTHSGGAGTVPALPFFLYFFRRAFTGARSHSSTHPQYLSKRDFSICIPPYFPIFFRVAPETTAGNLPPSHADGTPVAGVGYGSRGLSATSHRIVQPHRSRRPAPVPAPVTVAGQRQDRRQGQGRPVVVLRVVRWQGIA